MWTLMHGPDGGEALYTNTGIGFGGERNVFGLGLLSFVFCRTALVRILVAGGAKPANCLCIARCALRITHGYMWLLWWDQKIWTLPHTSHTVSHTHTSTRSQTDPQLQLHMKGRAPTWQVVIPKLALMADPHCEVWHGA